MSDQSDSKSPQKHPSEEKKSPKREHKKHSHKPRKHSDKKEKPRQRKRSDKKEKPKSSDKKSPLPSDHKSPKPSDKKDCKPSDKKQCKPSDRGQKCVDKKCPNFLKQYTFTSSVSGIMVPLGASIMKVFMLGGGGGGGAYINAADGLRGAGGGGGSGSYVNDEYCVKGGKFFDVKIGAGGRGGDNDNKNGQDGDNSTLTYDNHKPKVAEAGKGGMINLNGGQGGKGGKGSSCGDRGKDGREGNLSGRGGKGGNAPHQKSCHKYGNGGAGGSNPALPPPSPRQHKSNHREHKDDDDWDLNINLGPWGQNGQNGYCEVSFFSEDNCKQRYEQQPQHIVSTDSRAVYWANPDTHLITIDTSNFEAHLNLGRPASQPHCITFRLQHQNGLAAFITTATGGTFVLDSANAEVTLLFKDCVWDVSVNFQGIHSFFPTTLDGFAHNLENFVPSGAAFTTSVDMSADGNTLIIGAASDNKDVGAAYVYVLKDNHWVQEAKLVGAVGVGVQKQGVSVALSADGNTAAVGGNQDNSGIGAVWIFVRSKGVWSQQGPKLVDTGVGVVGQGSSVDLSADGNTLAVGAPYTSPSGKFFVYTRNNGNWSQTASFFNPTPVIPLVSPTTPAGVQGTTVALSANGSLLAVGASDAVYIYHLYAGRINVITASILLPPVLGYQYGLSLALSDSGHTLAVGQFGYNSGRGQVFVYVDVNGVWTQQGLPIHGFPAINGAAQGFALALTADGNTLAMGGPYDFLNNGAVWIFTRSDNVWTERERLVAGPLGTSVEQGAALALSSEGTRLVVGNDVPGGLKPLFWVWS